jgi:hypothetical protein
VRPDHGHGEATDRTRLARSAQDRERIRVAAVVAERDHRGRFDLGQQALERLTLAAGGPWPEIDHESSPVVGEVVLGELAIDRAADRSSACRTWKATDGPLRSTNSQPGRPSSSGTRVARRSAGSIDGS